MEAQGDAKYCISTGNMKKNGPHFVEGRSLLVETQYFASPGASGLIYLFFPFISTSRVISKISTGCE
jgi:hypothetical protein